MPPLDLLQRLVELESPTGDAERIAHIGRFLTAELEGLGASVSMHGQALVGEWAGDGRPLVLAAHMDTVWPAGTLREMPFRVADGFAWGPGALDMKAGIVAGSAGCPPAGPAGPRAQLCRHRRRGDRKPHTAALQEQGLTHEQFRSALLNRMSTRALVTGDYKLAAQALNLDLRIERNRLAQRRLDLQERRARALESEDERIRQHVLRRGHRKSPQRTRNALRLVIMLILILKVAQASRLRVLAPSRCQAPSRHHPPITAQNPRNITFITLKPLRKRAKNAFPSWALARQYARKSYIVNCKSHIPNACRITSQSLN